MRMHVDAKRYLCSSEQCCWETLSPASQRSLELQGGAYAHDQLASFMAHPFAQETVRLRRYDDLAKVANKATPALAKFEKKMLAVLL